jgi:hypothetical protein
MEFFNKNEEVIDITLTPRGRELLAQGLFKPAHYTFHDIDVRYENNNGESQNEIVNRIYNTPRLKTPTYYKNGNFYRNGITGKVLRKHILSNEIGDKININQYSPAWNINFIDSPNFQNYVSGSVNTSLITPNYYLVRYTADSFTNIIENEGLEDRIPQVDINYYYKKVDCFSFVDDDGKEYIKTFIVEEKDLVLEVDEINSFEENEYNNFNLEAFLENVEDGNLINLSFNKQIKDEYSIEQYLNISFDNEASFTEEIKVEDIYGSGGKELQTTCD